MLIENTLYGEVDKVNIAVKRLQLHEPPEGYYVAFSGGKDSCVVLDLCKRAGVKFDAHYNLTTVDPPELVRFIREQYPEVEKHRPELSMWQLIVKKKFPPTRKSRYCCEYFKERGGENRVIATGVRHAESARRSKRKLVETCRNKNGKSFIHPIIEWSDTEVWEYIKKYNIPYCSLYDEGFKRIGCIGCPFATQKNKEREFQRWPAYKKLYCLAFEKMLKARQDAGMPFKNFTKGEEVFKYWMEIPTKQGGNQSLFGLDGDVML